MPPVRHITLLGIMGAGKTSVGRELAQMLNRPFYDSDFEIERQMHMTVASIFEQKGEPWFREREESVIADIVEGDEPVVLSIGGGAFVREVTRKLLLEKTHTVYLQASLPCLLSRLHSGHGRPLLTGIDISLKLTTLLEVRGPLYDMAEYKVNTDDIFPKHVARRVADAIGDKL
ncbi:MAG: shikimate kinase [Candidatus Methylacidiphilales bacterium]|nr:shikimate kinase [Candidatus Methylacidiphilales bacterium]